VAQINILEPGDSPGRLFSFRSGEEVLPGDVFRLARGDVNDYRMTGRMRFAVISLHSDLLLRHGAEDTVWGTAASGNAASGFGLL
jgi:hypothetical protein